MDLEDALKIIIAEIRQMAHEGFAPKELADKELSRKTALSELNLDSLAMLSLFSAVEARADIIIVEDVLEEIEMLGDLARIVSENRPSTLLNLL